MPDTLRKVLFVDRDGTLIEEPADEQIDSYEKLAFVPGVFPALAELRDHGYELVMVTNQDGLGTESFPRESFEGPHRLMMRAFESQGIEFSDILIDESFPQDNAPTRKPGIGLVLPYLRGGQLDFEKSAVIGDRDSDVELAANMGLRGIRITRERGWPDVVDMLIRSDRSSRIERNTSETRIAATVNLDKTAPITASTGIGFFDHMLTAIAKHGGFSLHIECAGDLEIDEHHTVEDCAIVLGTAIRTALGERRGIDRFGFTLPMDESIASCAIDLSGRGWFELDGEFPRETVGQLPTEMVEHFFRSFADSLGATLNLRVRGKNTHHMVESCFKVVGRALGQAIRRTGSGEIPSTKGQL